MALTSTYAFEQTDVRGNFTFANVPFSSVTFCWAWGNVSPGSLLTVCREDREFTIDLYMRFNAADFLGLIDTPEREQERHKESEINGALG